MSGCRTVKGPRWSIRLGSGSSDPLFLTELDRLLGQELLVSVPLILLDLGQHCSEALVGNDIGLRDTPLLLKGREGDVLLAISELEVAIGVLIHTAPLAPKPVRAGTGPDQVEGSFGVEGEVLRDLAIFLPGEDEREVLIVADRAVV